MIERTVKFPELKKQRDALRTADRCINGPRDPGRTIGRARGVEHGKVVRGGKCQRCIDVTKAGRGGKQKAA